MAIKQLAETDIIPNPLHRYASYTYSWSLWRLQIDDFNKLMSIESTSAAMSWNPISPNSYVIAQDGGRYPDRRQPGTLGLNYHIQSVQFDSIIAPTKASKSSNMIRGGMTILEPYGVTLIDTLIAASWDGNAYNNYLDQPYMLQLEFRGYDDNGEEIPRSESDLIIYTKRFPIRMLTMKVEVTTRGTEYKIDFVPTGAQAHQSSLYSTTPELFTVTAGTVKEFFTELEEKFRAFGRTLVEQGQATYGDGTFFKIDPEIADSKIVNETKVSLVNANPKVKDIRLDKNTFTVPKGTPILDIITKIMAHSDYLIQKQMLLEASGGDNGERLDQTNVLNMIKTTTKIEYGGVDLNGQRQAPAIDVITNRYPKIITYNIMQYAMYTVKHPAANSLYVDSIPYTQKYYNYLYTGQNTDIVDLKINFDTTYYTSILAFTKAKASEESTKDTEFDSREYNTRGPIALNPAIFNKIYPQLAAIPTATPVQYRFAVSAPETTAGFNILDRPAAQTVMDVFRSIYTAQGQEMVALDLTIVGDPTLIKQDDWLIIPSPDQDSEFNDWNISAYEYTLKYGHSPMDRGQFVVRVDINSPVDMDIDQPDYNMGLAYPQPKYNQSLFSGQYIIISINNRFANGKFEQVLKMARIMNDEAQTAYRQARNQNNRRDTTAGPVELSINNDIDLVQTNPNKPASENYDPDNVSNEPLPIDTSIPPGTTLILNPDSSTPWTVEVNANPRQ